MRTLVAVLVGAVVLLAGCGSSSSASRGGDGNAAVTPTGVVTGTFQMVGGPMQPDGTTPHHSLAGTIVVHSGSQTGPVVTTTTVAQDGRYQIHLPAGTYFLVGRTPQITGASGGCPSFHAFKITTDTTTHSQVVCEVP